MVYIFLRKNVKGLNCKICLQEKASRGVEMMGGEM